MAKAPVSKPATPDLAEMRKRIDTVDQQIQLLINERARYAQQVGLSKGDFTSAVDYYRPEREAAVLRAVKERNEGPLRDEEMLRLFREIMSSLPGTAGTAENRLPGSGRYVYPGGGCQTLRALCSRVCRSPPSTKCFRKWKAAADADFGVVPIENSSGRHGQQHARHVPDVAAENLWRN